MRYEETGPKKELPSTEYSLKSISWHLKTFSDMTKSVDETLKKISVLMERQLEKQ